MSERFSSDIIKSQMAQFRYMTVIYLPVDQKAEFKLEADIADWCHAQLGQREWYSRFNKNGTMSYFFKCEQSKIIFDLTWV